MESGVVGNFPNQTRDSVVEALESFVEFATFLGVIQAQR
jgi:hypothetical protein